MGLFKPSPQELEIEKATSENNVHEDWGLIMEVCDKAGKSSEDAKAYLKGIIKRLHNPNPHINLKAATLLDACVNNCGKTFHLEVASAEFESEFNKLLSKGHPKLVQKLKESLKKWAEGEFKNDTQLTLIPTLYTRLKNKGVDFRVEEPIKKAVISKDPNVVQSQEEVDEIAKAIELSLIETSGSPRATANTSLYPSTNLTLAAMASTSANTTQKELRKVRALYDFEAAEDNELTFNSGEIIVVLDDSDANWWKGSNQRGEGLFPASFVTSNLLAEPEKTEETKKKQRSAEEDAKEAELVEINEDKVDRLLHLLHEADPTNSEHDTEEMLRLEREVNAMGPLIDTELERVDRKHAQLTQLSSDLVEALSLYHTLMREPQTQPLNKIPYGFPQGPPSGLNYNSNYHPQMGPSSMGFHPIPGQDRGFVPIPGMPPHFPPPQNLPPHSMGPMPHQHPPLPGNQDVGQHSLPPGMPPHTLDGRMIPTTSHFPQGVPNFNPTNPPQGFPPNGPQMPHQNGQSSQPGNYPASPNAHIM